MTVFHAKTDPDLLTTLRQTPDGATCSRHRSPKQVLQRPIVMTPTVARRHPPMAP